MRWLAKLIYFKILGWKVVGNTNFSKDTIKKAVLISAPHTHNFDFIIGLLLRKVVDLKSNYLGKKELFVWPIGYYFRAVGGVPVDRKNKENKVETIAKLFDDKEEFRLTLAPEGTRSKVDNWRTGFYYIAKKANVPIIMFTLDYQNKQNKVSRPFYPTDNIEEDFKYMKSFFNGVKGKVSKNS
ncbi:1-acyl-sn-glycerol-3-phosphate acyltransferase [Mesoflavibacter sabulilitoris]|uniref:Acyltransferase n=1 Tax=Mesoflavibacter zeaxanthinifaciens subsp. sabulilitoris TaxID=1520893 RepID=A0A2T1NGA3_9FLAO|nr:1-acyl-sn-glycerol-3-phosphate acyltransferase [Mesoflavibacter zeaxanthinifaciens]MBB3123044.1 1-acyl-sn-glycerol-3-phosphate acyltransferase [Mesoflavibacter zeaxanthinifaciens subsp. sabulilitoris]PSG91886.1 acyltransferase [Mesoflavibacter zeaxanthinifaciens subsp. sabulilitoris]